MKKCGQLYCLQLSMHLALECLWVDMAPTHKQCILAGDGPAEDGALCLKIHMPKQFKCVVFPFCIISMCRISPSNFALEKLKGTL